MRTSRHGLYGVPLPPKPLVSVSMLITLPETPDPYYEHREEVVRLSVRSMIGGIEPELRAQCDLMLYIHGSNRGRVQRALSGIPMMERWGKVERLENVGAGEAHRQLVAMCRGTYIAYTDDDVLFYPGWLSESLAVLAAFERCASVTGSPIRTGFKRGYRSALERAKANGGPVYETIPEEWERDFCASIGRTWEEHKAILADETQVPAHPFVLTENGVKAWGCGHHMQYVGRPERILPHLHYTWEYQPSSNASDDAIDDAGWMRLATYHRMTRHIGDVIDSQILQEAEKMGYL